MKKVVSFIALSIFSLSAYAQQIPLYSNYFFTPYVYNPAMSGTSGVTEATLLHRRQWTGIQGSPETSALALNGSLNDERVGWSVYGFSDQTDILSRLGIYGNYAYHVQLSDDAKLSFGLGAGYVNQNIDQSAVRAQDQGDIYTVIGPDRGTFDLNFGMNLSIIGFNLGVSAPQLLSQNVIYSRNAGEINYDLIRHYIFNASYDFEFGGDKQVLTPLVWVRTAEGVPVQVDAGAMFNMKEYGYVGAMFRSDYAVTGNLGVHLTEALTVGYAYDFSLNEYGSSFGTSHEFMLTYRFGSNKDNERMENELKRLKMQQRRQRDETEEIVDEKLAEFKDSYRSEIEKEIEQQREKLQQDMEQQRQNMPNNNTGNNNQQTGNNNQGGNDNQGGTVNQGQQGQNQNNTNQGNMNQGGNTNTAGNYPAANQASNVTPGSPGYYITAGVFSSQANAESLVRKLEQQGFNARYFQDRGNNFFYVYLLKFDNYQSADQAKSSRMNGSYTGDLWVKIVE